MNEEINTCPYSSYQEVERTGAGSCMLCTIPEYACRYANGEPKTEETKDPYTILRTTAFSLPHEDGMARYIGMNAARDLLDMQKAQYEEYIAVLKKCIIALYTFREDTKGHDVAVAKLKELGVLE